MARLLPLRISVESLITAWGSALLKKKPSNAQTESIDEKRIHLIAFRLSLIAQISRRMILTTF